MTHSGCKRKKPAENKFNQNDFTSFSMQVSANSHNFRFRFLRFTFKICETVAGTSTITQFHEFFNLIFGRFLQYDPTSSRRSFVRFVHIVSGLFCFASTVVPQQLSQKAFEKLATNQDLSNAIEKVSKDDDVDFYGSSLLPW